MALATRPSPNPFYVELASCMERALNFMHTGNTATMVKNLMGYFWLSDSLLSDGLPSINPSTLRIAVDQEHMVKFFLNIPNWPIHAKDLSPISAAKASILFHYQEDLAHVSYFQPREGFLQIVFNITHTDHVPTAIVERLICRVHDCQERSGGRNF